MRKRISALAAVIVAGGVAAPAMATAHHPPPPFVGDQERVYAAQAILWAKARVTRGVHAGRDEARAGRPADGKIVHARVQRQAVRLYRALRPGPEREHARRERARRMAARWAVPAAWIAMTARLRACESGGSPTAVSPGGRYRGAYQFDLGTWASVGGSGDPAAASLAEQHWRAYLLSQRRGFEPWPVCGAYLR
jgi:hypothetical protein